VMGEIIGMISLRLPIAQQIRRVVAQVRLSFGVGKILLIKK
jgi:hypothetical protein